VIYSKNLVAFSEKLMEIPSSVDYKKIKQKLDELAWDNHPKNSISKSCSSKIG
jgi:hypothetical protein